MAIGRRPRRGHEQPDAGDTGGPGPNRLGRPLDRDSPDGNYRNARLTGCGQFAKRCDMMWRALRGGMVQRAEDQVVDAARARHRAGFFRAEPSDR